MKLIRLTLLVTFLLFCFGLYAEGTAPQGLGTSENPYQIANLENLRWLSTTLSAWGAEDNLVYYIQTEDIDATDTRNWNDGAGFSPIGDYLDYSPTRKFIGSYDGQNHTISNLYINRSNQPYIGLFGFIKTGTISNLGIIDNMTTGSTYVGGLVGHCFWESTIENSYSTGRVSGFSNVGGLVGYCDSTTISYTCATGSVSGNSNVGGLVGYVFDSTISNAYATGSVFGEVNFVGGLVGVCDNSTISYTYATGSVSSTGNGAVGGLVGAKSIVAFVNNSFWDINTTGQTLSDGGSGLPTEQMTDATAYLLAGWDFVGPADGQNGDIWGIHSIANGGYPFLMWQFQSIMDISDRIVIGENDVTSHTFGYTQVTVEMLENHPEITLDVTLYTQAPNVVNDVLPPHVTTLLPVFWDVDSNGAEGYSYNFTFDLTEFSDLAEGSNFAVLKRDSAMDEWKDVLALGASFEIVGNQAIVSGLDSFCQFAVGNAIEATPVGENHSDPLEFPQSGVEIEFPSNNPALTLEVILIESTPTIVNGSLPTSVNKLCSNHWQVNCNGVAVYNITFDMTGFPELESYNNFRILKREDNKEEWIDVITLGGIVTRNGNKITVSGLDSFSQFVPAYDENETLPVTLSSFNAVAYSDEYVSINWVTESESNLLGFNVLRAETENVENSVRVNSSMIAPNNTAQTSSYSFVDEEVTAGRYYYWLETRELSNEVQLSHAFMVEVKAGDDSPQLPTETLLGNPYPSPFAGNTQADLRVKEGETASVTVYNLLGQVVKRESFSAGNHTFEWNGNDSKGNRTANGIYFFRMTTPSQTKSYKVLKLK